MSVAPSPSRPSQPEFSPFLAWLGAAAVGFGAGFAAVFVQDAFAPVGLFPLAIGLISGFAVGGVWLARGAATKRSVLLTGLLAGLVCAATLHYGSYFAARRHEEKRIAKAMLLMPDLRNDTGFRSFGDYMARELARGRSLGSLHVRGPWLALWWTLDAAAIVGAAAFGACAAAKSIVRSDAREERSDNESSLGAMP